MFVRTLIAAAALSAFIVPASAASVQVNGFTPTLGGNAVMKRVTVNYDDLNLSDSHSAATLYDRINRAATLICSSNPGGTSSLLVDQVDKCRIKAVKQAVSDVASPALTAVAAK